MTFKDCFLTKTERVVREYREKEEFGSWECQYDCSYQSLTSEIPKNAYYDTVKCDIIDEKEPIYIVIVSYSSGDSFGHSSGNIQAIKGYQNIDLAKSLANDLKEQYYTQGIYNKKDNIDCVSKYKLDYLAFTDYFARVENVYIEQFYLDQIKGRIYV